MAGTKAETEVQLLNIALPLQTASSESSRRQPSRAVAWQKRRQNGEHWKCVHRTETWCWGNAKTRRKCTPKWFLRLNKNEQSLIHLKLDQRNNFIHFLWRFIWRELFFSTNPWFETSSIDGQQRTSLKRQFSKCAQRIGAQKQKQDLCHKFRKLVSNYFWSINFWQLVITLPQNGLWVI